jgi:hypothetical protein
VFLDGLRSTIDDVLGLLEAEARDLADDLDDLDLFLANSFEDNVKLGLDFGNSGWGSGATATGAAAETPNFSSIILTRSARSRTVMLSIAERISSFVMSFLLLNDVMLAV